MSLRVPSPTTVVIWDRSLEFAESVQSDLEQMYPDTHVHVFTLPGRARDALVQVGDDPLPALAITDSVGLTPFNDGSCLARILRKVSPLSVIILYSYSAFQASPSPIQEWQKAGLIDLAIEKGDAEALHKQIQKWRHLWSSPAAQKLRAYIAICEDADMPYVTDGQQSLSLLDEHRHIVLDTDLGSERARIWERLMPDPVNA